MLYFCTVTGRGLVDVQRSISSVCPGATAEEDVTSVPRLVAVHLLLIFVYGGIKNAIHPDKPLYSIYW